MKSSTLLQPVFSSAPLHLSDHSTRAAGTSTETSRLCLAGLVVHAGMVLHRRGCMGRTAGLSVAGILLNHVLLRHSESSMRKLTAAALLHAAGSLPSLSPGCMSLKQTTTCCCSSVSWEQDTSVSLAGKTTQPDGVLLQSRQTACPPPDI